MRRIMMALATSSAAAVVMAMPATAAQGQVTHLRSSGTSVSAEWATQSDGQMVDTLVEATAPKKGAPVLHLFRVKANLSPEGEFLGGMQTTVEATGGFTFTYDAKRLSKASINGANLPAKTCVIDAMGEESDCTWSSVSFSATWTGVGPIRRASGTDHQSSPGFKMVVHYSGTNRDASVTGTFAGKSLQGFQWGSIGTYRDLKTAICRIPGGCEEGL